MRRLLLILALGTGLGFPFGAAPGMAAAQSSQLAVRGLGVPGRGLAARAWATGGGTALFDGESGVNPAALIGVQTMTAVFTGAEEFRSAESPAGDASLRSVHFPQFSLAGSLRQHPLAFGVSFSSYTVRDFTFGLVDTITLREAPVEVGDTFSSRGGLSDIRLASAYRLGAKWAVGAGFHVITGSNRITTVRSFADSAYVAARQRQETGYAGVGVSVGILGQLSPTFAIAATARDDGHVSITRDSTAKLGTIDLPYSFGGGLWWQPSARLDLGAQVTARTWSSANADLVARGEPGSKNTIEAAFGGEFIPDPRRPFRRPVRFGVRYATLPFLVDAVTEQPREFSVSVGSGARFAAQRAGVDIGLERLWRSAGAYTERSWVMSVGVSVRP